MKYIKALTPIIITLAVLFQMALPVNARKFSNAPTTNSGKKWRIAYYEGGEYFTYQENLTTTILGLMELGWIEKQPLPSQKGVQTRELWNWLSKKAKSKYLMFPKENHYSAEWNDRVRAETSARIIDRLKQKKDIDLMLAMGTWAGKDLASNKHHIPTMVLSTSDAVGSGIIKSVKDSGFDHVTAQVDPLRYERQVKTFHDIIGFKTLGIAFENSEAGRSYAAIDKVEKVSKELGFEIVSVYTKSDIPDRSEAEETVKAAFRELVTKSDAIYLTMQSGVNNSSLSELVKIANENKIPTFSQAGSGEVKSGILLSISQSGYRPAGKYYANTMAQILNHAKPRELNQVFEAPPKIAINLEVAGIIQFDLPVYILSAADEIYEEISYPQ